MRVDFTARVHERDAGTSVKLCLCQIECLGDADYNSAASTEIKEAHMAETRKVIDCRRFPADKPCSIAISGTEEDVVDLAVLHASSVHGHADSPELREQLRSMLEDETAAREAA